MVFYPWAEVAAKKRHSLGEQLDQTGFLAPDVCATMLNITSIPLGDILTPRQIDITESRPTVVVTELAVGAYTAVEVTVSRMHAFEMIIHLIDLVGSVLSQSSHSSQTCTPGLAPASKYSLFSSGPIA